MYEIFEHTADLGIRIIAGSLDELFADAARGLFSVTVENLDAVRPRQDVAINLRSDGVEELLHDWLAELLYTFNAQRLVLVEFQVHVEQIRGEIASSHPMQLTATVRGEPIDPERHQVGGEVKAVTWCGLKVERRGAEWMAEVIVDV